MTDLRVAVVGAGYLGRFHAQKYAALPGVALEGVVDVDAEAAAAVARETGTAPFTDHRELLGRVDAVSIVAPTPLHHAITRDFLAAGCDVLIEKPMTTTLAQADELIELAESRGLIIQVGLLERFNPAVKALRRAVSRPRHIEARRLSTFKPRAVGVSVVLDLMIHDIDIVSALAGSAVKKVEAGGARVLTDRVDVATAFLELENGCTASLAASRLAPEDRRMIRVYEKDAFVEVDFIRRRVEVTQKTTPPGEDGMPGTRKDVHAFDQADALADEIAAFVHSVRKREAPEVTGQVAREALSVALMVAERIERGSGR